jgi:hypothetical protein
MIESIKITSLNNIGSNLSYNSIFPVVDTSAPATTYKANLQIIGNLILSGAGGSYFTPALASIYSQSVTNAAQPNITSVGTLSSLDVTGNITAGNIDGANLISANFFSGDGGFLSNVRAGPVNTGNIGFDDNVIYSNTGVVVNNSDLGNGQTAGLVIPIQGGADPVDVFNTYGNVIIQAADIGNSQPAQIWTFGTTGNLTLPGNTWQVNYANGTQVELGGSSSISNANSNVTIPVANGNVDVNVDDFIWTFDTNGNLDLPGNIVGPANANFVIYANGGVHDFTFADDGTFYAPDNVVLGGTSISIGPGANSLLGDLANAVLVASSNSEAYIQAVITNVSDIGSADWVVEGHFGDDEAGWADFGYTSAAYLDANYTITGAGDGYVFAQGYRPGQGPSIGGGSLVLATGEYGDTKDIIFGTGGFSTENIFGRISDSNNALELSRTDSTIKFFDGTILGVNEGANTFGFYNANASTEFLIEMGPTYAWSFNGSDGNLTAPGNIIIDNGVDGNISSDGNINLNATGNVYITSKGHTFNFDSDTVGRLIMPYSGIIASDDSIGNGINIFVGNTTTEIGNNWNFGIDGNLTLPAQGKIIANGDVNSSLAFNYEDVFLVAGDTLGLTGPGHILLSTGLIDGGPQRYSWEFGIDGNLTLPGLDNSLSIFQGGSLQFDSGSCSWNGFAFGTQAFTIEFFFKIDPSINLVTTQEGFIGGLGELDCLQIYTGAGKGSPTNNQITVDVTGQSQITFTFDTIQTGVWYYFAVNSNSLRATTAWLNGVAGIANGSGIVQTATWNATELTNTIAKPCFVDEIYYLVGSMTNIRMIIGSAYYTSNVPTIAVPTTTLTNVLNTQLLLTMSNSNAPYTDSSANDYTVTPDSQVAYSAVNMFNSVNIVSGSNVWGFGSDGVLTLPNADASGFGNIYFEENSSTITFGLDDNGGGRRYSFSYNGMTLPRGADDPYLVIEGGANPRIISNDVSYTGSANLAIQSNYLNLSGSTGTKVVVYADAGEIATDANMTLTTNLANLGNTSSWVFGTDGTLTLPNGALIKDTVNAAVAFGDGAGANTQGAYSVAVGLGTGANTQGVYAVAVGSDAGANTQGNLAVAIGYNAGNATQGLQAVAVGAGAGQNTQGNNAIAIGYSAGVNTQGESSIAIGQNAGNTTQGNSAVAIGVYAGQTSQGDEAVAIGDSAGQTGQKEDAVAIGQNAGQTNQGISSVAIGYGAGLTDQGNQSVAIGENAGANQGSTAVAIGQNAGGGVAYQNDDAVAIGHSAGEEDQGTQAIAIGLYTGQVAQGLNSIALGAYAGQTNQGNNSIILNATGVALDQTTANTFTVAPVRNDTSNIAEVMFYNATSKEVTYGNSISIAGNINAGNIITGTGTTGNITGANVISANTFIGNGSQLTGVATTTTGSWELAPGVNSANISVPLNGTYSIWVRGNIPNGIVTYTATAVVTNNNVPVVGSSYGWYYAAGNALVLTSIPTQFVGTVNNISNAVVSTTTANVFTFGITNNSGANAVVNWGYTKL